MQIVRDARLAVRGFVRSPGFTAAAVLSLALGIGANTALFSVVHALLLQPLPYRDASRLVILWNTSPGLNITQDWFSTAQYFDIRSNASALEDTAIAIGANYNLTDDRGEPERVGCIRVSSTLLSMLGASATAGRLLGPEEDTPGRAPVAVLGYRTWIRRYGGDRSIVGQTIRLNDRSVQIVGVVNESFSLPHEVLPTLGVADEGEIFLPLPLSADARADRGHEDYNVLAKLRPRASPATLQAQMDALTPRLRRDFPEVYPPNGGLRFAVVPLLDQVVGDVRRPLWILFGSVGFVLLIACANVANLMLSRALGREREFAVRRAIGATRGRIAAQLVTESCVLSALGGFAGFATAFAAVGAVHALRPARLPRLDSISVDASAFAFAAAVALVTGVVFGLVPVLGRRSGPTVRSALVVSELAASIVLLIGAALLIQSFARLQNVAPGFDRRGVLTFELMMAGRQYEAPEAVRLAYRRLWEEIDRIPAVEASGGVTSLPLSGFFAWGPITIEGRTPPAGEKFINADQRTVSGRYFDAMRIPLIRGRMFDATDTPQNPRVAIVDERMADEFWPNQDPIGRRIRNGDSRSGAPWLTIVGVVGRVKQYALDADSRIAFYTPQSQTVGRSLYVVVKTSGDPAALARPLREAVRRVDPTLPLYRIRSMETVVQQSLSEQRFATWLLTAFAATALALALVGIYGVMSYLVAHSARDLGIRMALGATPAMIRAWVLRRAAALSGLGAVLGLAAAAALTPVLRGLMFGIDRADPMSFAATAVLLVATALAASYIPARRATRIDPILSIRAQ